MQACPVGHGAVALDPAVLAAGPEHFARGGCAVERSKEVARSSWTIRPLTAPPEVEEGGASAPSKTTDHACPAPTNAPKLNARHHTVRHWRQPTVKLPFHARLTLPRLPWPNPGETRGGSICNASGTAGQASEGAGQLPYPHSGADRRHWALVLGAGHKSPADPVSAGRRGEPAWEAAAGWWRRSLGPRRA